MPHLHVPGHTAGFQLMYQTGHCTGQMMAVSQQLLRAGADLMWYWVSRPGAVEGRGEGSAEEGDIVVRGTERDGKI